MKYTNVSTVCGFLAHAFNDLVGIARDDPPTGSSLMFVARLIDDTATKVPHYRNIINQTTINYINKKKKIVSMKIFFPTKKNKIINIMRIVYKI